MISSSIFFPQKGLQKYSLLFINSILPLQIVFSTQKFFDMVEISIFASTTKVKYTENRVKIRCSGYFMKSVNFKLIVSLMEK